MTDSITSKNVEDTRAESGERANGVDSSDLLESCLETDLSNIQASPDDIDYLRGWFPEVADLSAEVRTCEEFISYYRRVVLRRQGLPSILSLAGQQSSGRDKTDIQSFFESQPHSPKHPEASQR